MHKFSSFIFLLFIACHFITFGQKESINRDQVKEDLEEILTDIQNNYVYLADKKVSMDCIRSSYSAKIGDLQDRSDVVLFFEYLLDEFYDTHMTLNTNIRHSFRLYSPIYVKLEGGKAIIANAWLSQIENLQENIIGAEVISMNGQSVNDLIDKFPTMCQDKKDKEVREWLANKVVAGRYNEARTLELKLSSGKITSLNLDELKIKKEDEMLQSGQKAYKGSDIGIIRINNRLGENSIINLFNTALDSLMDTDGLIIDLRNTVDGGNSYVARGIMGRFVNKEQAYQKHVYTEKYGDNPAIQRSWIEYVVPRGKFYDKPVIILVDRWTGSMGEGLAIGFEAIGAGKVVGTEMERLAGSIEGFGFKHQRFGYRIATQKLYHINGTPREEYVPTHYIQQKEIEKDEFMEKALELLSSL